MAKPARLLFASLTIPTLIAPLGCGRGEPAANAATLRPISGRVTSGGKPAVGVEIQFHPLNRAGDSSAPRPVGTTDKQGRFTLRTGVAEGAPIGDYQVAVTWPAGRGKLDRLGGDFDDPQGSGLTAVIDAATTEIPTFEIGNGPARKSR